MHHREQSPSDSDSLPVSFWCLNLSSHEGRRFRTMVPSIRTHRVRKQKGKHPNWQFGITIGLLSVGVATGKSRTSKSAATPERPGDNCLIEAMICDQRARSRTHDTQTVMSATLPQESDLSSRAFHRMWMIRSKSPPGTESAHVLPGVSPEYFDIKRWFVIRGDFHRMMD
jgi:hypothetical protein